MNLTIEQMRKIVDGAPDWAKAYNTKMKMYTNGFIRCSSDIFLDDFKSQIDQHYYGRSEAEELAAYAELSQEKIEGGAMLVGDFSKARERIQSIFEDDRTDYVDFKVGDKVVFDAHFCDEHKGSGYGKITYCTMDKRVFEIDSYYLVSIDEIRHATPEEIAAGHRIDANTDYVTDIRNHISPMTIVQGD
ncbi:hypothetical protein [Acinetobacter sp. YH01026]|uniref:hypothetical protein n=1 Tax=Acinetobacter sp. YH01026 TaxID=2601039 RepID=UPI0015D4036D|nr:hypothetical protein [Acinetobacter sp. YH01026]